MKIVAHLTFDGQCRAAFDFYQRCFGGTFETLLTYGESPMAAQAPPEWRDKILHVTLNIGDSVLMGADTLPGQYEVKSGIYVAIQLSDIEEAERIYTELAEGGMVRMPLQETFWAPRYGALVDRFGTPWEINCAR